MKHLQPDSQQPRELCSRRPKNDYEVVIEGIGKSNLHERIQATSAGMAKLAAQDKFGRWIKVVSVTEMAPGKRRSREAGVLEFRASKKQLRNSQVFS